MAKRERAQDKAKAAPRELALLRRRIDGVDDRIVSLLARRAALAVETAAVKRRLGLPIHAPGRERQLIARVRAAAPAPLSPAAVARIFRDVIAACRVAERARGSRSGRGSVEPPARRAHAARTRTRTTS